MRSVYLVLAVMPWGTDSEEDAESRFVLPSSSGDGFCAVFDTLEEAQREWPGEDIMELHVSGGKLNDFERAAA